MVRHWIDALRPALLIAKRELRDQLRDWRIIFPIIFLTLISPLLMNLAAKEAMNFAERYGTPLIAERLVPFLLLVVGFFPITVSLVIALEAFVGEKERGTIEPLLSSPLEDWQLYLGKLLASTSAPLSTAYIGIGVYLIGLYVQAIPIPEPVRLLQILLLTTVQAFLMVSGAIVISTQATSIRSANLMASFIVIPMALLIQGESVLMFWGNDTTLWLAIVAVSILAALLARVGLAHFQREALLGREIDVLNFRWIWRTFWSAFAGESKSILSWYRNILPQVLKKQKRANLILGLLGVATSIASFIWLSSTAEYITGNISPDELSTVLETGLGSLAEFQTNNGILYIFGHNLQALIVIFFLGMFSFGVLGVLAFLANMGLIGGVLGLVELLGLSPTKMAVYGLLPHGVFELPALVLSSAAVLSIGAVLVTPDSQRSLGEVFLEGLADWMKIVLGLVIPLLAIAAIIEVWVTPVLLSLVLKSV
ncbi:MAG: stage II sporulation protein M [Chloroflexota bacterium]